jgi:hypothetical protein
MLHEELVDLTAGRMLAHGPRGVELVGGNVEDRHLSQRRHIVHQANLVLTGEHVKKALSAATLVAAEAYRDGLSNNDRLWQARGDNDFPG